MPLTLKRLCLINNNVQATAFRVARRVPGKNPDKLKDFLEQLVFVSTAKRDQTIIWPDVKACERTDFMSGALCVGPNITLTSPANFSNGEFEPLNSVAVVKQPVFSKAAALP